MEPEITLPQPKYVNGANTRRWRLLLLWASLPAFVCATYIALWFYPFHVLTVNSTKVFTDTVSPGDDLVYELNYCKEERWNDLQADIQYTFVGTDVQYGRKINLTVLGKATAPLASGCSISNELIVVPPLPPGLYSLQSIRQYYINPLLPAVEIVSWSTPFHVVPITLNSDSSILKELLKLYGVLNSQLEILIHQNQKYIQVLKDKK